MMELKPNRRLGNRKTTTGCKTCKLRKLKCDEAKPRCLRCTRSGRLCSGYASNEQKTLMVQTDQATLSSQETSRSHVIAVQDPCQGYPASHRWGLRPSLQAATDEKGLFQLFRLHAPNSMAGILDAKFWTVVVPQVCSTWPSVRYGIMALSALLYDRSVAGTRRRQTMSLTAHTCDFGNMQPVPEERDRFDQDGAGLYGRALASTAHDLSRMSNRDVAALTCIIFFCIECLQGNLDNACSMLRHGQNLVRSVVAAQDTASQAAYYEFAELTSAVDRMFSRIRLAVSLSGRLTTDGIVFPAHIACYPREGPYRDVCEARRALFEVMAGAHNLHLSTACGAESTRYDAWDVQARLLDALEDWRARAATYLCTAPSSTPSSYEHQANLIFWCHYRLSLIWLRCALSSSELAYDEYYPQFHGIVESASAITRIKCFTRPALPKPYSSGSTVAASKPQAYASSPFQLETGILMPLYVTACKCRCPILRRQAVYWLQRGPSQEGLLERDQLVRVALRVMELEMQALEEDGDASVWPAEEERIVSHQVQAPAGPAGGGGWARSCRVKFSRRGACGKEYSWYERLIY